MPQFPQKQFLAPEAGLPENMLLPRPVVTPVAPLGAEETPLSSESNVIKLRAKCVELGRAVWGTKQQLYERIQVAENSRGRGTTRSTGSDKQRQIPQKGISTAKVLPAPELPSEEEQRKHELTHLPTSRWIVVVDEITVQRKPS